MSKDINNHVVFILWEQNRHVSSFMQTLGTEGLGWVIRIQTRKHLNFFTVRTILSKNTQFIWLNPINMNMKLIQDKMIFNVIFVTTHF